MADQNSQVRIGTWAASQKFGTPYDVTIEAAHSKARNETQNIVELWLLSVIDQGIHPKDLKLVQKANTETKTVEMWFEMRGEEED